MFILLAGCSTQSYTSCLDIQHAHTCFLRGLTMNSAIEECCLLQHAVQFTFMLQQKLSPKRCTRYAANAPQLDLWPPEQRQLDTRCELLPAGPSEVSAPGFALRTGFAGACVYYLSVHVLKALKPAEGLALITSAFVVHGLCSDLLRKPLDWTHPLAIVAHKIVNVPMPSAHSGAKKPQNKQAALPAKSSTHSSTEKKKDK